MLDRDLARRIGSENGVCRAVILSVVSDQAARVDARKTARQDCSVIGAILKAVVTLPCGDTADANFAHAVVCNDGSVVDAVENGAVFAV